MDTVAPLRRLSKVELNSSCVFTHSCCAMFITRFLPWHGHERACLANTLEVGIGLRCAKVIDHRIASLVLTERLDSWSRFFPFALEMSEVGSVGILGLYAVHRLLASVKLL